MMLAFQAEEKAIEICGVVFQNLGKNGPVLRDFQREFARERFTSDFSNIWLDYQVVVSTHPIRTYPTKDEIDSAVAVFKAASKTLESIPQSFPRIGVVNGDTIKRLLVDLRNIISAFNFAETHKPSAGRPANDPTINRAVKKIVEAYRIHTEKTFPLGGDYAPDRNGESAFSSEYAEFVYQLMCRVDKSITRPMISTALRQQNLKKTAKTPPEKEH